MSITFFFSFRLKPYRPRPLDRGVLFYAFFFSFFSLVRSHDRRGCEKSFGRRRRRRRILLVFFFIFCVFLAAGPGVRARINNSITINRDFGILCTVMRGGMRCDCRGTPARRSTVPEVPSLFRAYFQENTRVRLVSSSFSRPPSTS